MQRMSAAGLGHSPQAGKDRTGQATLCFPPSPVHSPVRLAAYRSLGEVAPIFSQLAEGCKYRCTSKRLGKRGRNVWRREPREETPQALDWTRVGLDWIGGGRGKAGAQGEEDRGWGMIPGMGQGGGSSRCRLWCQFQSRVTFSISCAKHRTTQQPDHRVRAIASSPVFG